MVTVSDPVAFEQKNCVSCVAVWSLASKRYTSRNWKFPPLTSGAACSTVARMPSHSDASCGSRLACSALKSWAKTAVSTRPAAADSASRSSEPSSACAVQLVAQLASGVSNKADAAKTFNSMRIPANILSAQ